MDTVYLLNDAFTIGYRVETLDILVLIYILCGILTVYIFFVLHMLGLFVRLFISRIFIKLCSTLIRMNTIFFSELPLGVKISFLIIFLRIFFNLLFFTFDFESTSHTTLDPLIYYDSNSSNLASSSSMTASNSSNPMNLSNMVNTSPTTMKTEVLGVLDRQRQTSQSSGSMWAVYSDKWRGDCVLSRDNCSWLEKEQRAHELTLNNKYCGRYILVEKRQGYPNQICFGSQNRGAVADGDLIKYISTKFRDID